MTGWKPIPLSIHAELNGIAFNPKPEAMAVGPSAPSPASASGFGLNGGIDDSWLM